MLADFFLYIALNQFLIAIGKNFNVTHMLKGDNLVIIGIIATLAIPITIFFYRKYRVGAFLTLKMDFDTGHSRPIGVKEPYIDEEGFGIRAKSIVRHHLVWTYNVTITNNSDHTAFFPCLYYKNDHFPNITVEDLPELKPIGSKDSIVIEVNFLEISDTLPNQRRKTDFPPTDFNCLKFLLEYYNGSDTSFYTLYDNADKQNKRYYKKPKF